MKKAVIGIVPLVDAGRESLWMLPAYMEGIQEAGGLPVMLPLTDGAEDIEAMAELCSGFLFTGDLRGGTAPGVRGGLPRPGSDGIPPAHGGHRKGEIYFGYLPRAAIHQCGPGRYALSGFTCAAALGVRPSYGCPLRHTGEIGVNSCHHQGLKVLSPRLKEMASAPDGLIEAAYMPEIRFAWAVQWHPEFSRKADANSQRIFDAFVRSCDTSGN